MAKPSTITTWATDPGATADPGPTRRATGFVAGKKLPAKWLNWLISQNAAWLTYLRDLHSEPEFLNKAYVWTGPHRFPNIEVDDIFSGVIRNRTRLIPLDRIAWSTGAATIANGHVTNDYGISCWGGLCEGLVYLDFPLGIVTITNIRMLVNATANGTQRPRFALQRVTPSWSAGPTTQDLDSYHTTPGGASGYQVITTGTIGTTYTQDGSYLRILIEAGRDATSGDRDTIVALEVTYSGTWLE